MRTVYPDDFEDIWRDINNKRAHRKEVAFKVYAAFKKKNLADEIQAHAKQIQRNLKRAETSICEIINETEWMKYARPHPMPSIDKLIIDELLKNFEKENKDSVNGVGCSSGE